MKSKWITMAVLLTVFGMAMAAPLAYAGPGGEGSDEQGYQKGKEKEFFKDLNLNDEQKAKLKAIREAKKEARKASREQFKAKMQALHDAIAKPGSTRADVNGLVAEVNAMKAQHFSEMIDGVFEMKAILTPEQFAKMQAKHKERWEKKQGNWKQHGPDGSEGSEGPDHEG